MSDKGNVIEGRDGIASIPTLSMELRQYREPASEVPIRKMHEDRRRVRAAFAIAEEYESKLKANVKEQAKIIRKLRSIDDCILAFCIHKVKTRRETHLRKPL